MNAVCKETLKKQKTVSEGLSSHGNYFANALTGLAIQWIQIRMAVKAVCRFATAGEEDILGTQYTAVLSTFKRHFHSL